MHRIVNEKTQEDIFSFTGEVPREGEALWIEKQKYRVIGISWKISTTEHRMTDRGLEGVMEEVPAPWGRSGAIIFVKPVRHFEDELKAIKE